MGRFTDQVNAFIRKAEDRQEAIVKTSIQETVAHAQVPMGAGGKMRIDTGFLRSSLAASIGSMPIGETKGDPSGTYNYDGTAVALTIFGLNMGETFYAGWTANYARPREATDGFMRSAAMQWGTIVTQATIEAKARIP